MRSSAPALLPVFRSRHLADLLAFVLLHPDAEYSTGELARSLAMPLTTVHREIERMLIAGVFSGRRVGRSRLVRANTENRAYRPLTELLTATFGPHVVIAEEFAPVAGARLVILYGSWAARYHGEPGEPPRDVDVLVVGDVDRGDVYDAADTAAQRLALPVNPVVVSPHRWAESADPLIRQIASSPIVVVHEAEVAAK